MRSFRQRPVGWRHESYRHYLAAKGVKTNRYYAKTFLGRLAEGAIEERERYEDLKRRQQAQIAATAPVFSASRAEQQRRAAIGVSEKEVEKKLAELSERRVPVPNWMNVSSYRVGIHAEDLAKERSKAGLSSESKRRLSRKVALATKIQDDLDVGVPADEISNAKRYEGYSRREVNEILKDSYSGVVPKFGAARFGSEDKEVVVGEVEDPTSVSAVREKLIKSGVSQGILTRKDAADVRMAGVRGTEKDEEEEIKRIFSRRREPKVFPEERIEDLKDDLDALRSERSRVAKHLSDLKRRGDDLKKQGEDLKARADSFLKPGDKIHGYKDISTGKVTKFRKRK